MAALTMVCGALIVGLAPGSPSGQSRLCAQPPPFAADAAPAEHPPAAPARERIVLAWPNRQADFQPLLAVVTLPFLAPLAALLQLLFPGLLRDQWRRYRIAVAVLTTQSTLLALHWGVLRWFVKVRPRWLADDVLWSAVVGVAGIGLVAAIVESWRNREPRPANLRPAPVEFLAVGGLLLAGLCWAAFQWLTGVSPWDQMAVVTLASTAALGHLVIRARRRSPNAGPGEVQSDPGVNTPGSPRSTPGSPRDMAGLPRLSTEIVLVGGLVVAGIAVGWHVNAEQQNQVAAAIDAEWPLFRGNLARTGTVTPQDEGPVVPEILWVFDPRERKGRVRLHSSPAVVDGFVYVGGMHEVQTLVQGAVYCVNAAEERSLDGKQFAPGERLWKFTDRGALKPVFSSPSVAGGFVFFGEGYHQDRGCRLFCLDARQGDRALWEIATDSHVESSPALDGSRVYFGAGDDGVICLQLPERGTGGEEPTQPKRLWQVEGVHVDGSCLVANGKLFVGSVQGDVYREFCALAIETANGHEAWRVPTPMPIPASPAFDGERVFFGLGNGKMDFDAEHPAGAVWCVDAATGSIVWQFDTAGSVLATPAISEQGVVACSREGRCYCLARADRALLWQADLGLPLVASPIVAAGKIYVVTVTGLVAALDARDGSVLWRLSLDAPDNDAFSSPTLSGGRLYVAAGGKLYCIGQRKRASEG